MHQQMLARYDAERRALGFGPVVPFADYREPIGEGYEDRPSGQALRDVDRQDTGAARPRRARAAARPPARRGHRGRRGERRRPRPADLGAAGRARGADRRDAVARRLAPRLRPRHHRVRDGAATAAATRATSATPRRRSATPSSGAGTATSTTPTSRCRSRPSRSRSTTRPTSTLTAVELAFEADPGTPVDELQTLVAETDGVEHGDHEPFLWRAARREPRRRRRAR